MIQSFNTLLIADGFMYIIERFTAKRSSRKVEVRLSRHTFGFGIDIRNRLSLVHPFSLGHELLYLTTVYPTLRAR